MSIFNKHRIFCPRAFELRRIAAGIVFSLCGGVYAQQVPVMPGFGTAKQIPDEQRTINNVNVNIEGKQNVSKEAVYAHIRLRKGMKFDQRALDLSTSPYARFTPPDFTTLSMPKEAWTQTGIST